MEGIRGIALVVILSAHLIEWPTGGFVALDLFFVLSGYLITGLIIREYERSSTISMTGFYRRRIRRLAPAATLVIVVTVAAAFAIFPTARAVGVAWDGFWSMLLVANWNFVFNGTDYFATSLPQSPLLHYWSLAVEEQFYLFWPALLLAALTLFGAREVAAAGRPHSPRREVRPKAANYSAAVAVIAVVSILSFAWGVIQPLIDPAVSYLSTLTRIWELGAGALLFFGNKFWRRLPSVSRPVLAWTGLAIVLAASVVLTPDDPYPSYYALIPIGATAMIIVAGVGGDSKLYAATNPVARYLGQISYSAYLWHWPVIVFVGTLVGRESPWYLWGAVPLSLVLAAATFHFVENPIRESTWLEPKHRSRYERRARRVRYGRVASVAVAVVAVAAVAVTLNAGRAAPPQATVAPPAAGATPAPLPSGVAAVEEIMAAVGSASAAQSWPDPVVAAIDANTIDYGGALQETCLMMPDDAEEACAIGAADLPKTAVLLGDSVALSWSPGLGLALNDMGYRLLVLTQGLCPFAQVDVSGSLTSGEPVPGYPGTCNEHRDRVFERLAELKPDLVIAADAELEMTTMILPDGADRTAAWRDGLVRSVQAVQSSTLRVLALSSPPRGMAVLDCYTRVSSPVDCMGRVTDDWFAQFDAAARAQAQLDPAVFTPVDTRDLFCATDALCPAFAGDLLIRSDEQHITTAYSEQLRGALREMLAEAGVG
ncbi:acyltransferase family protein [Microbacterium sp.]|uniref:acyltransferase family protein n=1 Tax=Microbacterium sp. TaxID=51671 RepID=UPI0025D5D72E|nr:acyltransferase family protein [Microbacterium sp.]